MNAIDDLPRDQLERELDGRSVVPAPPRMPDTPALKNAGKLGAGLHRIPMEEYLQDPAPVPSLSSGCAHTILTYSPRHAWFGHPRLNPNYVNAERTDFDIGTCAHALLLERSEKSFAVIDPHDHTGPRGGVPKGWTNDSIKAAREMARAAGKTPILVHHAAEVREMVAVAQDYIAGSEIAGLFDDGEAELTMLWDEGPVWMRARPDWLSGDQSILFHYKTTARKAEPESFGRQMLVQMGYDMTALFYERGLYAMPEGEGRDAVHTVFLVQETEPPYECSLIGLAPELADLASRKVERAIRLWDTCMRSGDWPAYPRRICYIDPKPWQVADFEEREAVDALAIDRTQFAGGGFAQA